MLKQTLQTNENIVHWHFLSKGAMLSWVSSSPKLVSLQSGWVGVELPARTGWFTLPRFIWAMMSGFLAFFPDLAISSQPFQSEQQKAAAPPHMNSYQSDSLQMQAVEETLGIISKPESYSPPPQPIILLYMSVQVVARCLKYTYWLIQSFNVFTEHTLYARNFSRYQVRLEWRSRIIQGAYSLI